jgi:malyl-CoA/(S)-citramalyl-CoA lyase
MTLKMTRQATTRINRSELAVPGSNIRFMESAISSSADVVFLDLEDAVAPDEKEKARKQVIEVLQDLDWSGRTVSVRINGLDTQYMYRDVVDVVEQAGDKLDLIMIPKVGTAGDVYAVDALVSGIESAKGYEKRIGFELIIETALGMQNMQEIAEASTRIESLHFGVADYAASTQARTVNIGGANPNYHTLTDPDEQGNRAVHWGDMWHFAISRLVMVARANGLRPIDGPFGDISDPAGFEAQARRSAALGCEGKWAIHPSQVDLANRLLGPGAEEVRKAEGILRAMEDAQRDGQGAVCYEGRMIDLASVRQAEILVKKAAEISARDC